MPYEHCETCKEELADAGADAASAFQPRLSQGSFYPLQIVEIIAEWKRAAEVLSESFGFRGGQLQD